MQGPECGIWRHLCLLTITEHARNSKHSTGHQMGSSRHDGAWKANVYYSGDCITMCSFRYSLYVCGQIYMFILTRLTSGSAADKPLLPSLGSGWSIGGSPACVRSWCNSLLKLLMYVMAWLSVATFFTFPLSFGGAPSASRRFLYSWFTFWTLTLSRLFFLCRWSSPSNSLSFGVLLRRPLRRPRLHAPTTPSSLSGCRDGTCGRVLVAVAAAGSCCAGTTAGRPARALVRGLEGGTVRFSVSFTLPSVESGLLVESDSPAELRKSPANILLFGRNCKPSQLDRFYIACLKSKLATRLYC